MAKAKKAAEQPTTPEQSAPEQSAPEQEAPATTAPEQEAPQPTETEPPAPPEPSAPPEPARRYVLKRKGSISFHGEGRRVVSYDKGASLSAEQFAAVPQRQQKFFEEVITS